MSAARPPGPQDPVPDSIWMTPAAFMLRNGGVRRLALHLASGLEDIGVRVDTVVDRTSPGAEGMAQKLAAQARQHRALLAQHGRPVVHSIYYDAPLVGAPKLVVTVLDMIHERFGTGSRMLRVAKRRAIRKASVVACISQQTADDLVGAGVRRDDIVTIHLGVSDEYLRGTALADPLDGRPFVLYVGDRGGYKNFELVVETLASSPELDDHGLVLVGGPRMEGAELDAVRARRRGIGAVVQLVDIDDEALGGLYRAAAALVIPSRYEGFGFPLVEAMASGCPVASSGGGSLAEIDDGRAFRFDPDSVSECRAAIHAAIDSDEHHRQGARAHARQFTWNRTAAEYCELYARVAAGDTRR